MAAMRVLTDPADTERSSLFRRTSADTTTSRRSSSPVGSGGRRPAPEPIAIERAAELVRAAKKPLVVAGGGVVYSGASDDLRAFATATGIPVADTHAGQGAINFDHECSVGGVGSTGSRSANVLAEEADVVIGIGTRYSDFTTASHTQFKNPDVKFVNINVAAFDAAKHSAEMVVADAREALRALATALDGYRVDEGYSKKIAELREEWSKVIDECYHLGHGPLPAQTEVFGALNELMGDNDVVINAAGSMPGDLQALWRSRTPVQYHVEYAFSAMGYEIPAALGVKLALPESEVVAIVGDGTYQMLPMELATIVQEGVKAIFVLLQNHGFASIGALSESHGSQRFGTRYRKGNVPHHVDGELLPVDIAANAESWASQS